MTTSETNTHQGRLSPRQLSFPTRCQTPKPGCDSDDEGLKHTQTMIIFYLSINPLFENVEKLFNSLKPNEIQFTVIENFNDYSNIKIIADEFCLSID